jgi:hypothetical protein
MLNQLLLNQSHLFGQGNGTMGNISTSKMYKTTFQALRGIGHPNAS